MYFNFELVECFIIAQPNVVVATIYNITTCFVYLQRLVPITNILVIKLLKTCNKIADICNKLTTFVIKLTTFVIN